MAQRNLQAVGATDSLKGRNTVWIHLNLSYSLSEQHMKQSKVRFTGRFVHNAGNVTKPTVMIFPVLLTVRPEFLKPELMATEC